MCSKVPCFKHRGHAGVSVMPHCVQVGLAWEHIIHCLDEEFYTVRLGSPELGSGNCGDWDSIDEKGPQDPVKDAMLIDSGFKLSR